MGDTRYDFKDFKVKIAQTRAPLNDWSYSRWYTHSNAVADDFSIDEIKHIIRTGDIASLRELSRFYYRTNSHYKNNIDYLANLFLYDWAIIPVFEEGKGSQTQIIKAFYKACDFIDKLNLSATLSHITTEWLIEGIYYGILRESGGKVTVQDLPSQYCRTRFKDFNNLNILEFNLNYFNTIHDADFRAEAIQTFPDVVQKAWARWIKSNRAADSWVAILPTDGGICFTFVNDPIPALIASLPELKDLDDATKREAKRDENELYKLLIQKMPIDNKGELVFQLEEVADIHASVAQMLANTDTVDVLTTFGDTSLESLQDTTAASQSADRIAKYKSNAWGALGRGEILFNANNSSTLAFEIKKDETIMRAYMEIYEIFIKYLINTRFARKGLSYGFQILPTTIFNRSETQQSYFRGAQYGYSKMLAGVVMGITQLEQLSLMTFENDFLEMSMKMIPLQSSYTTPGGVVAEEEKNSGSAKTTTKTTLSNDITNTGGRPELPAEQKSEKTQANIDSMG